jgi:hypothetical protein
MQRKLRRLYRIELTQAKRCYHQGLWSQAFGHLERAHVLGQRFLVAHYVTHWWMLKCGWRLGSVKEVLGQLLRLLAVLPGFLTGWVPLGNTGGANVSAIRPMPLPAELLPLFGPQPIRRDMAKRLVALCVVAILLLLGSEFYRYQMQALIDSSWQQKTLSPLPAVGAVKTLKVTTLVNWHSADPAFSTEAGVSYLIEADGRKILFDVGFNRHQQSLSPLQANMDLLDVFPAELDKLLQLVEQSFTEPLYAIVGDLHLPVPHGRLEIAGIDVQRRLASGNGVFDPMGAADVQAAVSQLAGKFSHIWIGGHDSSDETLQLLKHQLPGRVTVLQVGDSHLLSD